MSNKMTYKKKQLARDLVKEYEFTQNKVAELMGVTQSTISKAINESDDIRKIKVTKLK